MHGVLLFLPRDIYPQMLSTTVMTGGFPFGQAVLVLGLLGILACLGGAGD
jgi:hypothetical protein